ncbi:hypothetical protein [Desulfolithobacter sp.]
MVILLVASLVAGVVLITPVPGRAEMLKGTVVHVDRTRHSFTLKPEAGSGETITVQADTALPGCVTPGETIRAWGTFTGKGTRFEASDIRGTRGRFSNDPTGVRSRLERGLGRGFGRGGHGGRGGR